VTPVYLRHQDGGESALGAVRFSLERDTTTWGRGVRSTGSRGSGTATAAAPARSGGLVSDIRLFLLHRPDVSTLISMEAEGSRANYTDRIRQRLGISVAEYAILNVHKIGIEAPVGYVFEELRSWDGDSTCWPNHLAMAERVDDGLEHVRILLFGRKEYPFGLGTGRFGLTFVPLFDLKAAKIQDFPDPSDGDNARYLLFESSGGYPIGVFAMYVRSGIADMGETELSQLFLAVGFNFYGRTDWAHTHVINRIWETIHNRATANIMHRFKQLCEWRFQRVQAGSSHRSISS
jgi:hypothetical protein